MAISKDGPKSSAAAQGGAGKPAAWPAQPKGAAPASAGNPHGFPLEAATRSLLEKSLGADLSDVRVLPNSAVTQQIGAKAFTHGNTIHFAPGAYNAHSATGRSLLAHELTHVVQQRGGAADK